MKRLLTFFSVILIFIISCKKNLQDTGPNTPPVNNSSEKLPLTDLGIKYWRGNQGGLYPNGLNTRPLAHHNAGLQYASDVKPLDANGNYDPVNGKIVWLSVGMSNTTQETQAFIPMAEALLNKNPKLVLVDGAQGGWDIDMINNPSAAFWANIISRLAAKGVTAQQVQAIWFKQADRSFPDTSFAGYVANFKNKLKISMAILKEKYPNAKLCYLSSRIYGGYQTGTGSNPEPYAYYTGWAVKSFIEDQINGNSELTHIGSSAKVPWLSWGAYLWANGATPRDDGLKWIFPEDYLADGIHPSTKGRQKVAEKLLEFFTTDATTIPWFLK